MKIVRTLALSGVIFACAIPVSAGPIFLTGHDPDFHAQDVAGPGGQDNLLRAGIEFVTGGSPLGTKFLWVESRISPPGGHRIGELGIRDIGYLLGTDYDRVNGAEFASVNLSDYTAIAIASSFGGLLTRAELDALIGRKTDLKNFINDGGGLFASAECYPCGASLLGGLTAPSLFGFLPIPVTSIGASGSFTVTAYGNTTFGLVNADMNFPTHNSFGLIGGLNVVDRDSAQNATTLAGIVRVSDDELVPIPEPGTLSLIGVGLLGVARRMRRNR